MVTHSIAPSSVFELSAEICAGLSKPGQKELPSKYLYDEVGSALFEVISVLPEYGLTRADERLLRRNAAAIVDCLPLPVHVAELGSGSAKKTRWLLEALVAQQATEYFPIDISAAALAQSEKELGSIESLSIVGYERSYLDGLLAVAARRREGQTLLVLFLGSTIGNFDRPAGEKFLAEVRRILCPGDALLLSTDLEKPLAQLMPAYDDPAGVTAAFNLNLLAHVNRCCGADFDLSKFRHEVRYDCRERRIEMHLRSLVRQTVSIPAAHFAVQIAEGETIWTESSHKYRPNEVVELARRTGFECRAQWLDASWPFAQSLLFAV